MNLLVYKLTLTPLAVALATAVGRRFGPAMGGWVAGIPFTSAPVAVFVTLEHGVPFGTLTAIGILAGTASQSAFAFFYSVVAVRLRWPYAIVAGAVGFAAVTVAMEQLLPPPVSALEIAVGSIALALALMPRARAAEPPAAPRVPARVDIISRAVVATAFVIVLTALSQKLGPTLAGLLSPIPIFGAVLIVFPHRQQGSAAAISACRGFLWGLFAAATFGFVLSELLPNIGLAGAMAAALASALVVQGLTLLVLHGRQPAAPPEKGAATQG
ncbi:MAG: hypothetical protein JOZ75_08955 [Candidatus Dormibacteraeota bacterium]|nr:hypothetical protein [Candidatus Dormibacteraeota bacterium]